MRVEPAMSLSREEAAAALDTIEAADARVKTVKGYAEFSPYLLLWGAIWLVCNGVSDLARSYGDIVWLVGLVVGLIGTIAFTIRHARCWTREHPDSAAEGRAIGRRVSMLGATLMIYFPVMMALLGPLSPRQTNAFISVTWALVYMATGAFIGWRIFAIGCVTAAAVLFGYFFIGAHYQLWMALVGGGSLIAGGLWLRKI